MKKYIGFLIVFGIFVFGVFIMSGSAQATISGCLSGQNYSTTTGQACPTPSTPTITVYSPSNGDVFSAGQTINITWTPGLPGVTYFSFYKEDQSYSTAAWAQPNPDTSGSMSYTFPSDMPAGQYKIYAFNERTVNGSIVSTNLYESTGYFSILSNTNDDCVTSQPSITVLSPNGGETYTAGQQIEVKWKSCNVPASTIINIELGQPATTSGISLVDTGNDGSELITLPTVNTFPMMVYGKNFKIKLQKIGTGFGAFDYSDNLFAINPSTITPSSIKVLSPNGGETWVKGTEQKIKWQDNSTYTCPIGITCNPTSKYYDIYLSYYCTPGESCPQTVAPLVYTIAKKVTGTYYLWDVGKANDISMPVSVPDGAYIVAVRRDSGLNNWDESDSYFKIVSFTSSTIAPIISGISGPQTLNINQTGTWKVTASSPNGGNLSYSVVWGDEAVQTVTSTATRQIPQQSATFTHSYSSAGIYTPTFTVTNSSGGSATTSLSVNVGNSSGAVDGCVNGEIYSSTTGQKCINSIIDHPCLSSGAGCANPNSTIKRILKVGVKGEDVKTLQSFLGVTADGSFGPMTKAKVIEWQAQNGLKADGLFGTQSATKAGLSN